MRRIRIIPALLLRKSGLVKTVRFKDYKYVGDPINAVRIFNEKEVDELAIIDIDASAENRGPAFDRIADIVSEAFMPLAYGGGISQVAQAERILMNGAEKVILNKAALERPSLVGELAKRFGSQSVMVSIDYKKNLFGKPLVYTQNGRRNSGIHPLAFAKQMEEAGAGEILLTSIDRDGTFSGYDLPMIETISSQLNIPLIAMGGASTVKDFCDAARAGASAVAAGSMFVFQQPHKAVLISYPAVRDLTEQVFNHI